jgi:hypothetical protein
MPPKKKKIKYGVPQPGVAPLNQEEIGKFLNKYSVTFPVGCKRLKKDGYKCRKYPNFSPIWAADKREDVPPRGRATLSKAYNQYAKYMELTLVYSTTCDQCHQLGKRWHENRKESDKKVREAGDKVCINCRGKASDGVEFPPNGTTRCLDCQSTFNNAEKTRRRKMGKSALDGEKCCSKCTNFLPESHFERKYVNLITEEKKRVLSPYAFLVLIRI